MKLAVNYSPQAAKLYQSGEIELDVFKTCSRKDVTQFVASRYPTLVHFPLRAGRGNLHRVNWHNVMQVMKWSDTPRVNVYMAPYGPDFPGVNLDRTDAQFVEMIAHKMIDDIEAVKAHLPTHSITLENAPWDPSPAYAIPRPAIEPEVIRYIVEETGCGFSLDLAHARMAAIHLEMPVIDYIDALPLNALCDLSLSGVMYDDTIQLWRDHFAMSGEDWAIAEWIVERIANGDLPEPDVVALEYGGVGPKFEWRSDPDILINDASHLHITLAEANMTLENRRQLAG